MLTKRRAFLQQSVLFIAARQLFAAVNQNRFEEATRIIEASTNAGLIKAATVDIRHGKDHWQAAFGRGIRQDAMFLLGSITKPISVAAFMSLVDDRMVRLDEPVRKYLPDFRGDGRDRIRVEQLLTHVSGLPDQLPENARLRASHAPLIEFVDHAQRTPLLFRPGSRYGYSSMAILLASRIAEIVTGDNILTIVQQRVFDRLELKRSALGLGRFDLSDFVSAQTGKAAPESGAGDPSAQDWDWNSRYWRALGAPWGTGHASAADIRQFLEEFLFPAGHCLRPETARKMIENRNPEGLTARGLGFNVGTKAGSPGCSEATFGHTGSTGTLCWADPRQDMTCVILTSLPGRAVTPHPRVQASDAVARMLQTRPR